MTEIPLNPPFSKGEAAMPNAWYALAGRVGAAQAVTFCAQEASGNTLGGLLCALQDLLSLMRQDVDLIETQLKL